MSSKSRSNYRIPLCIKDCNNKCTKTCELCIRFNMYEPISPISPIRKDWKDTITRKDNND